MRILVTGGAGFIGSNFIRRLLDKGVPSRIVNLDKLTYAGNLESLSSIQEDPRYEFVRGDIAEPSEVAPCFAGGVDAIVNFAAESHVDRSIEDSTEFIRTNVTGTQILLDAARRYKVSRYVQVSTDEVYGSLGPQGAFTEQTPLAPNSPYAASKAAADLLVRSYARTHGLQTLTTRCSNNYGPYQFPEKLIPLMILNAIEGRELPIYGDGLYTRDWIHVDDHCDALEAVLMNGRPGEVYNIGAGCEQQNISLVRRILQLLGKGEEMIRFVEDRPGHDRRYAIDSSRVETELSWTPRIAFDSGLEQTVKWYLDNPEWISSVRSGDYAKYYDRMYEHRSRTLTSIRRGAEDNLTQRAESKA